MDVKQTLIDAQAAVIGSVLISPEIVGDVMLRVSADDFLTPQYRHVFDAVHEQWAACQAVDVVTVLHRLGDAYRPLLVQIMADTPTAANWEAYADVMREQARLARIKDAAAKMLDAATLDEARAAVETASECLCDSKTLRVVSWYQGLCEFYQRHADGHQPDYLRWGIRQLDARLYAERGDLIILGGLPSSVKTLLATQFAMHMARSGLRIGVFSLETSDAKLYDRMVAQTEGINFGRIKRNQMVADDYKTASTALQTAQRINLDVIRASGFSVTDVQAVAMARRYDCHRLRAAAAGQGQHPRRAGDQHLARAAHDGAARRHRRHRAIAAIAPGKGAAAQPYTVHVRSARVRPAGAGRGRHHDPRGAARRQPGTVDRQKQGGRARGNRAGV